MRTLLWVSMLDHITKKTGVVFLPLTAIGVQEVCVTLSVLPSVEQTLREAAKFEGRSGWSSRALSVRLAKEIKEHLRPEAYRNIDVRGGRLYLTLDTETCTRIAESLESDQIDQDAADEEEIDKGHAAVQEMLTKMLTADTLAADARVLLNAFEGGTDVRSSALRLALTHIGTRVGWPKPVFLRLNQFQARSGPTVETLRAAEELNRGRELFLRHFGVEGLHVHPPLIVRVQPKGDPWTGIVIGASLPGLKVSVLAAWNADNRVD